MSSFQQANQAKPLSSSIQSCPILSGKVTHSGVCRSERGFILTASSALQNPAQIANMRLKVNAVKWHPQG